MAKMTHSLDYLQVHNKKKTFKIKTTKHRKPKHNLCDYLMKQNL